MHCLNNHKLSETFETKFGKKPQLVVRAPGRINLIGEHTDYNNGFVLPAAIDKAIVFAVAKSGTNTFQFYAVDLDDEFIFGSNDLRVNEEKRWANYLIGVIAQFEKEGYVVPPLQIVFGGNIPLGAGLSSSAAVECGLAYAINALLGFQLSKVELAHMAQKAEHEFAGVQCGIMDQFASLMGAKEHVIRLDCQTLEYEHFPFPMDRYQIVLCDTQVKHSLASSEYNTRRRECEEGVSLLASYYPDVKSLRDVNIAMLEKHKKEMDPIVFDRCQYVVNENIRVLEGCKDLAAGNLEAFGKKMYASHEGLSNRYVVSCSELDFLVEQTQDKPYVLGARMMGGGFGGCTINLVKVQDIQQFELEMKEAYKRQFNVDLITYKVAIEDGVGLLPDFMETQP